MSKGLNTDSMSRLLGGLTGSKENVDKESTNAQTEPSPQEATSDVTKDKKSSKSGAEKRF